MALLRDSLASPAGSRSPAFPASPG